MLRGQEHCLARITLDMTSMMVHESSLGDVRRHSTVLLRTLFAKRTQVQWPNPKEFGAKLMQHGWWRSTQANDITLLSSNDFSGF
jgi:hypothetical protein